MRAYCIRQWHSHLCTRLTGSIMRYRCIFIIKVAMHARVWHFVTATYDEHPPRDGWMQRRNVTAQTCTNNVAYSHPHSTCGAVCYLCICNQRTRPPGHVGIGALAFWRGLACNRHFTYLNHRLAGTDLVNWLVRDSVNTIPHQCSAADVKCCVEENCASKCPTVIICRLLH